MEEPVGTNEVEMDHLSDKEMDSGDEDNVGSSEAGGNSDAKNGPVDLSPNKDGGVIKEIIKPGKGWETPKPGDKVFVHYVGKLLDGTVFDSSRDRGQTFSFTLGQGQVIKGWDLAVESMKGGELAKVTIKSEYAYGEAGSPPKIPPNSTLIFEIELYDWKMTDCTKKADEGVRKRIVTYGEGYSTPNDGATVQVHIVGKFGDRVFDERDVTFIHGEAGEANVIDGIDLGIGRMKKGEKALLYIRQDYAWGANPPPQFNLPADYGEIIYEVELKSFEKVKETWEMSEEEKLEQAKIAKEKGSNYFKQDKFQLALKNYKKIPKYLGPYRKDDDEDGESGADSKVDAKERDSVLLAGHLNLSMVYIKLNQHLEAIKNCDSALEIDPNNTKGLFRRGIGYYHIQEYEKAIRDFEKVIELEPDNKAAKNQLVKSRHALKIQNEKEKALLKNMISKYLQSSKEDNRSHTTYSDPIDEVQFLSQDKPEVQPAATEVN